MGLRNSTAGLLGGTLTAVAAYTFVPELGQAGETARLVATAGMGGLSGLFSYVAARVTEDIFGDHGAAAKTLALLAAGAAAYGGYEAGQIPADRMLKEYIIRYSDASPAIEQGEQPAAFKVA